VADYADGMSSKQVADKYGLADSTVLRYVTHEGINRSLSAAKNIERRKREAELALTGGRWVNVRGVMRWQADETPAEAPPEPIACPCGARLSEPCRTTSGNWTRHADRITSRRCSCGNVPREGSHFCTDECRREARAATYREREKRTPTRLRRVAA
jgi:hypothetical protein